MLFAAIDMLMCALDYFKPSGWNDQLECEPKFEPCTLHATRYTHKLIYCFHKNPMLFNVANFVTRCVEERCFKGPDAAADLLAFFSLPIIMGRFVAIMDATLNSRTGKRFFKAPKAGAASSKGRTKDPISGRTIDNNEPESASMGNPTLEFDLAGQWEDFMGTASADECAKCFVCKARP